MKDKHRLKKVFITPTWNKKKKKKKKEKDADSVCYDNLDVD